MAIKNELSILTKAEQLDLYSPPLLGDGHKTPIKEYKS
jgi:hypothetical protein